MKTTPTQQPIWQALVKLQQTLTHQSLTDLFAHEATRNEHFSVQSDQLYLDFSKNHLTQTVLAQLIQLATESELHHWREALLKGDVVNPSEHRAALHSALRDPKVAQADIREVNQRLAQLDRYENNFTDIIHIGIGGSDQGPLLVYDALQFFAKSNCQVHFLSYHGPQLVEALLAKLNPKTTAVVIVSKSFTTIETLSTAKQVMQWLKQTLTANEIAEQTFAVSTNVAAVNSFGIEENNIFPMWDSIGGRFSVWSAVSLSLRLALGHQVFNEFLAGAHAMDLHFKQAEFAQNMPVLLALIDIWYNNFWQADTRAIIPYHSQLRYLPGFLQQLHMESLGKHLTCDNQFIDYKTGNIIWGDVGAHSQHSYMQLLQQGNQLTPIDFVLPINTAEDDYAISNCMAQSETLAFGYKNEAIYKCIPGNVPNNVIVMKQLSPASLGELLALYEHKVFVCSVIWQINAFDQWGVERGKVLAKQLRQFNNNKVAMQGTLQWIRSHKQ